MDGRGDNREIHLLHCNSQAPCVREKRRAIERERGVVPRPRSNSEEYSSAEQQILH